MLSFYNLVEAQSQTIEDIQKRILKDVCLIDWYVKHTRGDLEAPENVSYEDSLFRTSESLKRYLIKTLPKVTGSISLPLPIFPDSLWLAGLKVKNSADDRIRQWRWDSWTGGFSMPRMYSIIQYKTPQGDKFIFETAPDWIDTIYTIKSAKGTTYYLPLISSKYSSREVAKRIEAWSIQGNRLLRNIKLFQEKDEMVSSMRIDYDYHKSYDWYWSNPGAKNWVYEQQSKLLVPQVEVDSVIDSFDWYDFNGNLFIYKGTIREVK